MTGGWIGAFLLRGPWVQSKEFTKTDRNKLKGIVQRIADKLKYGLSAESETKELNEFYESMIL